MPMLITMAVRMSACGSGSVISSAVGEPSPQNAETPGRPAMSSSRMFVALPTSTKPMTMRVMLRSSIT